jgi:hypothetical protein
MTDSDTAAIDALLDQLEARWSARAQARHAPLVNAAGDDISQLAAAGRVHVNPGDTILDTWGNMVFDQSVNIFASTTDRDTQWPAPPDGALCYTQASAILWARTAGNWLQVSPALPVAAFAPTHFRAIHGAQSIPRTVWTDLTTYNAPAENTGGGTFTAGVYTVPAAGRYLVVGSALITIPTTASAWVGAQMQVLCGSAAGPVAQDIRGWYNPTTFNASLIVTTAKPLAKNDTIKMQIYNGHPSAAMSTFAGYLGLEIHRIE